jgi:hypothetical protein
VKRLPIAVTAPPWFEVTRETAICVEGLARFPRTRWADSGLAITVCGSRPVVRETVPGSDLPRWCLERHIFGEAEFCLGLKTLSIRSHLAAERWWDQLAQFIVCQSVASETGLWPLMNGLDHGTAGYFHNHALDLAERLDILEEYLSVQSGYAAGFSTETVSKLGEDPRFVTLLEIEARRHDAKAANDIAATRSSRKCCGTMRDCPYRPELKITLSHPRSSRSVSRDTLLCATSAPAIAFCAMALAAVSLHSAPVSAR